MTVQTRTITSPPDLGVLAAHLLNVFPMLDETGQRVALALYRRLSEGNPVPPAALADMLRLPVDDVSAILRLWPGVYYDDGGRVIGFWGLTIAPMPHRLRKKDRTLYAWCAWDTLFLPELIGATIEVESACRASGKAVRLTATPSGIERADPADAVLSFLLPDAAAVNANVITSFCHYVHFFRAPQDALPWLAERPDAFLLSLADAYELGRRINRTRYGESLLPRTEAPTNGFSPHV